MERREERRGKKREVVKEEMECGEEKGKGRKGEEARWKGGGKGEHYYFFFVSVYVTIFLFSLFFSLFLSFSLFFSYLLFSCLSVAASISI